MKKLLMMAVLFISLNNTAFLYAQDNITATYESTINESNLADSKEELYLKNSNVSTENGKLLVTKIYELPAEIDRKDVIKQSYIEGDYEYVKIDIEETDIKDIDKIDISDTKTISTNTSNRNSVLGLFEYTLSYLDDDGYSGELQRQDDTLSIVTTSTTTKWYTLNDTKYYYRLPNKDISNINKSISKDGITLNLIDIEWINTNNDNVNSNADTAVGSLYTCKADYSGKYSKKIATVFSATVNYSGYAEKEVVIGKLVKVKYLGEKIPEPETIPMIELQPAIKVKKLNPLPVVAGTTASGGLVGIILFMFFKKNVHIYNMQSGKYELIGKQRIKTINPNIDITPFEGKITTNMFKIVIAKSLANSLVGKDITVSLKDRQIHHTVLSSGVDYVFDIVI